MCPRPDIPDHIVQQTLTDLAEYDFTDRNEAEIRGDWIEPLLRLLGYGLGTPNRIFRERNYRLEPPVRELGSKSIQIDFIPTVRAHRLWIMEAKRPKGDDLFSLKHLGQAWSYATDPRVAVSLMALCDGTRFGVFDVTRVDWSEPILDVAKTDLPLHYNELFEALGATRVAERVRTRQLEHLKAALESQVDDRALDRTIAEVAAIVDAARPIVRERRDAIRDDARAKARLRGASAIAKGGMRAWAQHLNGSLFINMREIEHAAAIVEEASPVVRRREFDFFVQACTRKHEAAPRMWWPAHVARLGCAILLCGDEELGDYFVEAAHNAARLQSSRFEGDELQAASYRLQRVLGPLGWRIAAHVKGDLDAHAAQLLDSLDVEEWLRQDGEMGVTAYDFYKRQALLFPQTALARVKPWTVEAINEAVDSYSRMLDSLPKLEGFQRLQPAGDPWLETWRTGEPDPMRRLSRAVIGALGTDTRPQASQVLAAELLAAYFE